MLKAHHKVFLEDEDRPWFRVNSEETVRGVRVRADDDRIEGSVADHVEMARSDYLAKYPDTNYYIIEHYWPNGDWGIIVAQSKRGTFLMTEKEYKRSQMAKALL